MVRWLVRKGLVRSRWWNAEVKESGASSRMYLWVAPEVQRSHLTWMQTCVSLTSLMPPRLHQHSTLNISVLFLCFKTESNMISHYWPFCALHSNLNHPLSISATFPFYTFLSTFCSTYFIPSPIPLLSSKPGSRTICPHRTGPPNMPALFACRPVDRV